MISSELRPTQENIIKSIEEDWVKRNESLAYFYRLLIAQESSCSIALDGRWGSGKTFFVKQTKLLLDAMNFDNNMEDQLRDRIQSKIPFSNEEKKNNCSNIAVYYDAWENDNDIDPVASIVYEIINQIGDKYTLKNDTNIFQTAGTFIDTISGKDISKIIKILKGENPLSKIMEQKHIEEKIKEFFSDIINERGNRLVVFIDELDRCSPKYAVKLLEQIKHYLCDNRLTFVFSVNLEEIQHTIKQAYGISFDACRYLDRFFDMQIALPPADMDNYYSMLGFGRGELFEMVMRKVIRVYHMELREISRLYTNVQTAIGRYINKKMENHYGGGMNFMILCLTPLIIGLRMTDISLYDRFIKGVDYSPMIEIFSVDARLKSVIERAFYNSESLSNDDGKTKETIDEKIKTIYEAIFVNDYSGIYRSKAVGDYEFDENSKQFLLDTVSMLSQYAEYK